jgi:hypothetical protein
VFGPTDQGRPMLVYLSRFFDIAVVTLLVSALT